jgi:UDP-2-acetamido-3-amino-2,3-dideoxy-glucuronate N-acetyltransferase
VVTHDVPPYAKVVGNPARIIGYTHSHAQSPSLNETSSSSITLGSHATAVKGVNIYELPLVKDLRGNLSVGEFERSMPFTPKRYFLVFDVPSGKVRGEHAHKQCHQFLICIKGSCAVVADDGLHRQEMLLDRPNKGVHLPPMTWGVQYKYSTDAILLVFASDYYEASDYIRDYDQFADMVNAAK